MVNIRQQDYNNNISLRSINGQSAQNILFRDSTDYLSAGLARDWAIRTDGLVENTDYSSKYYALKAKQSEANTKDYMERTLLAIDARVPVATSTVLGGIKVGPNLSIESDGTLSGLLTAQWGNISGNILEQSDLGTQLDLKLNKSLDNLSTDGCNKINQSKAQISGNISSDSQLLEQLKSMVGSSFDITKFTVNGTPTISSDGIVSNFSSTSYIKLPSTLSTIQPDSNSIVTIEFKNVYVTQTSGEGNIMARSGAAGWEIVILNNQAWLVDRYHSSGVAKAITYGYNYDFKFVYDTVEGKSKLYFKKSSETDYGTPIQSNISSVPLFLGSIMLGKAYATTSYFDGTIDLKNITVVIDDVPVFSGNKTGTDTYTIGGSTVSIPYTISKTGSKIVDSAYRTQVTSVYNTYGYAPYYTLSDTDFTLPQGELYGMIERCVNIDYPTLAEKSAIADWICPDYASAIDISSTVTTTSTQDRSYNYALWLYMGATSTNTNGATIVCEINGVSLSNAGYVYNRSLNTVLIPANTVFKLYLDTATPDVYLVATIVPVKGVN